MEIWRAAGRPSGVTEDGFPGRTSVDGRDEATSQEELTLWVLNGCSRGQSWISSDAGNTTAHGLDPFRNAKRKNDARTPKPVTKTEISSVTVGIAGTPSGSAVAVGENAAP